MKMKKTLMAAVLVAAVGIIGLQQAAAAHVHDATSREDGSFRQFQGLDEATKEKIEKFRADTQDLRKQMVMKRAEESALIRSETPNIEAVRKAAGELFDLRSAMQMKAKEAGLFTFPKRGGAEGKLAERHQKLDKFLTDTQDLRKQMSVKRAEERALMHNRTPNAEAVAQAAGELFVLRTKIHEKAKEAGLTRGFRGMGDREMGPGRHFFRGHDFGMMEESTPWHHGGPCMTGEGMAEAERETI
jgi:hypothetical protein